MFCYCPQCGLIQKKGKIDLCPACDFTLADVPAEYLSKDGNLFISREARQNFIDTIILSDELYNAEIANKRESLLAEREEARRQSISQKVSEYKKDKPAHHCPVCGSNNLTTISNVGKVAKIALIGVWGAGDLGKKWHCNSCGYKF